MKSSAFKIVSRSALALTLTSTLLLAGCDKTEVPIPGLNQPESAFTKAPGTKSNSDIAPPLRNDNRYVLVSISHQPGYTVNPEPDYTISLYNNGEVVFQGVSDVAKIGTYRYNVSLDVVNNIQNLLSPVFYNIKDLLTAIPDSPDVITTYQLAEDIAPVSLIDNGQNYPLPLIELRKQVETMLRDQSYVGNLNNIISNSNNLGGQIQ